MSALGLGEFRLRLDAAGSGALLQLGREEAPAWESAEREAVRMLQAEGFHPLRVEWAAAVSGYFDGTSR